MYVFKCLSIATLRKTLSVCLNPSICYNTYYPPPNPCLGERYDNVLAFNNYLTIVNNNVINNHRTIILITAICHDSADTKTDKIISEFKRFIGKGNKAWLSLGGGGGIPLFSPLPNTHF